MEVLSLERARLGKELAEDDTLGPAKATFPSHCCLTDNQDDGKHLWRANHEPRAAQRGHLILPAAL